MCGFGLWIQIGVIVGTRVRQANSILRRVSKLPYESGRHALTLTLTLTLPLTLSLTLILTLSIY